MRLGLALISDENPNFEIASKPIERNIFVRTAIVAKIWTRRGNSRLAVGFNDRTGTLRKD